ncbi:eukaryotic translation initiation factor 4E binding protein [Neoconidiobolus thromboides FSU 785]|nr:eukaryotic translation initiation factor 4E binding protein [Neoconidiobolus thromboides FSU 785]
MSNSNESSAQNIPIRVRKADPSLPIPSSYSTTPRGTIFSTTPGGTRIIYDRHTLLNLRNSPLSRTPPANLGFIPGVTKSSYTQNQLHPSMVHHHTPLQNSFSAISELDPEKEEKEDDEEGHKKKQGDSGELFDMEME